MQLTKVQKVFHTIFRILVFLSLGAAICEFFLFMSLGIAGESSAYSYSSTLSIAKGMCSMYYVLLILGVLTVVFSVICCRCTNVAATVTRTIFLVIAVGFNFTSFPAYQVISGFADAYLSGNYYSLIDKYAYVDSDDFEIALVFAVLFVMISIGIYFVLSITSIVALAKKPQVNNNAYNQYYQNLYGRGAYNANGQWNNGNTYMNGQQMNPNMNNQWNNANPQMNPNMNNQWNNANPQMNPNMNNQWNNANPQMNPNMNNQWNNTNPQMNQGMNTPNNNAQFDENGVKQSSDGRKILCYDTMTGEPIYEDSTTVANTADYKQEENSVDYKQEEQAVTENYEN